jgi:UDP-N-acetylmuramate dehydrogenase
MTLVASGKKFRDLFQDLFQDFRGRVTYDEPMARHTSFRIGGPADVMVIPKDRDDLSLVVRRTREEGIPIFLLGGGCNVLVRDGGIRGIVVALEGFDRVTLSSGESPLLGEKVWISVEAGKDLAVLLQYAARQELAGLEFTAGIPGTLGGALIMNAGSFGGEMKDVVRSVTVMDSRGEIRECRAEDLEFRYRFSRIPGKVILSAVMELERGERGTIREKIHHNLVRKKKTQPVRFPSAGSVFKNPQGIGAWQLIHDVGMRGVRIGGAQVSEMHTNYFVNRGGATARDVLALIQQVGRKVERDLGVTLELEIRVVGEG